MYVCVSECVCETQGGEGMVRGSDGDIAGSREARHCVVQLWEAVGVYSVCVCARSEHGGLIVCVCLFVPFVKLAVCMCAHLCGLNLGLFV